LGLGSLCGCMDGYYCWVWDGRGGGDWARTRDGSRVVSVGVAGDDGDWDGGG
jgi:hypothetical protein